MRPSAHQRGYDSRWNKARKGYLRDHPWCVECAKAGLRTPATRVDHVKPHRGDRALFWDKSNWQPLCQRHHDSDKQAFERSGKVRIAVGADGWPKGGGGV